MALPITVPFTFANATTTQNLSSLDADFATVYNAVNGIGNGSVSLSNVNITGGTVNAAFNSTIIQYGTSNVSVNSSNGPISINTNGSNAMYIDASQNVGIGTISPANKLQVNGQIRAGTNNSGFVLTDNTSSAFQFANCNTSNNLEFSAGGSGSAFIFYNNGGNERMRIDSSGNLLVGQVTSSFGGKICTAFTSASQVAATFTDTVTSGYTGSYVVFLNSSSAVAGYISHPSATTVGYVASSDYRLKKDVAPLSGSLDRVMKLKPVSYTWTEDDVYGEGFIAHELQEVIPLAAYGIKDAVNEDGSIKPQGVDYGKLTTVLVAAMQEQQKLIQELSAEVTALKAKVGQ